MKTVRTLIRRLTIDDLPAMIELETDPEVMKFTRRRVAQTPSEIEQRFVRLLAKEAEFEPLGIWGAEELATQSFVGWFMLVKLEHEFPELGFMIPRRQWGKGFATEVCAALVSHGFDNLELEAISAVTDIDNLASRRVLTKLGFAAVGDEEFILRRKI
ncbi:MAG: GNAT family N-acetyltransferase [Bdellovibrionota bacterium]